MIAATSPDVGPFSWQYVVSALVVAGILAALFAYAAWVAHRDRPGFVERWLDQRIARRHLRAARQQLTPWRCTEPTVPRRLPGNRW